MTNLSAELPEAPEEVQSWIEVDGEIVPSYAPGHGNHPNYLQQSREERLAGNLASLQDTHELPVAGVIAVPEDVEPVEQSTDVVEAEPAEVVVIDARRLAVHAAANLPRGRTGSNSAKGATPKYINSRIRAQRR